MVYDKEVNMNKKSIITMMLALVALAGQAQGYHVRSEQLCLSLHLILERMLLTDVRLTTRSYELMMASVLAISA